MDHGCRDVLPPDMASPEMRALLVAYLNVITDRVRILHAYRTAGAPGMSMLDLAILQLVSTFELTDGEGSHQYTIVNALHAPRRTVRDGLKRMVESGNLWRREDGCYFATEKTLAIFAEVWPEHVRTLRQCAAATISLG
jgi:hypothetical protein